MRRLIPHYLKSYEQALIRYQEEQEKEQNLNLIAQAVIKVTGGRLIQNTRASRSVYFENGIAEIWSGGDITLNLNRLTPDQAIQIASMFRGGPTLLDRSAAFLRWNPISRIMPPLRKFLLHFHALSVKPYFEHKPLPVF